MGSRFYPNELRAEAVRLVVEKRLTAGQVALQLDVRAEAVSVWVRRHRESQVRANDIQQLRILLRSLAMERDELAKIATHFFEAVADVDHRY